MKKTNRVIAVLLVLLTLCLLLTPAAAAKSQPIATVTTLNITTGDKAKQLVLQWNSVPGVKGYEIWRSTTGKTGSYQRLAAKSGTSYTDAGLKNATTYYYAVRTWALNSKNKTVYGAFKKANLSTRVTKSYTLKRFQQTWKVMDQLWSSIKHPQNYLEDAETDTIYYPITFKGYTTCAQLRTYLCNYFTKAAAKAIVKTNFKEIKGKLYAVTHMVMDPQNGLQSNTSLLLNDVTVKKMQYADKRTVFTATMPYLVIVSPGAFGDSYETIKHTFALEYEAGRWVFAQTKSFSWCDWNYQYAT